MFRGAGKDALHLLNARSSDLQVCLGQVAVDENSNEITAVPKLLDFLELAGAVATLEAMHCQKAMAQAICDKGAVLPLPSVVRLLGHAKLPDHLGHRLPLSQPNLSLAELPNDLLRSQLLSSWPLLPSLGFRHQRFSLWKWRRLRGAGHGPVLVSPGARLTLDVGAAGLTVAALTLDAGGLIDLGYGRLTIAPRGFTESVIRSRLIDGRGDASWIGTSGIMSRTAASLVGGGVGSRENADGSLAVAFAAAGDMNLEGGVDILDVTDLLASGLYDSGLADGWPQGDFNYDNVADVLDIQELLVADLYDSGPYLLAAALPAARAQSLSASEMAFAMMAIAAIDAAAGDTTKILERPFRVCAYPSHSCSSW